MILRGLAELCLMDQRRQPRLKSMLCGKASATPFCQRLSHDFRCQVLFLFFPASERSREEPGDEAMAICQSPKLSTRTTSHTMDKLLQQLKETSYFQDISL